MKSPGSLSSCGIGGHKQVHWHRGFNARVIIEIIHTPLQIFLFRSKRFVVYGVPSNSQTVETDHSPGSCGELGGTTFSCTAVSAKLPTKLPEVAEEPMSKDSKMSGWLVAISCSVFQGFRLVGGLRGRLRGGLRVA